MMPQAMAILFVSRAMIAVAAVDERASMECLRQPEDVEAGSVTGLRHEHGLVERLHAQLQNANSERKTHRSTRSFLGSFTRHQLPFPRRQVSSMYELLERKPAQSYKVLAPGSE